MDVIDEVVVIYAASQGFLDTLPKDAVQAWEKEFLEYFHTSASELQNELKSKKDLTPEIEQKLVDVIKKFNTVTTVGKKVATQYNVPKDEQKALQQNIEGAKQPVAH
jgi:F-type H+-transporting ATPase subunit alpha